MNNQESFGPRQNTRPSEEHFDKLNREAGVPRAITYQHSNTNTYTPFPKTERKEKTDQTTNPNESNLGKQVFFAVAITLALFFMIIIFFLFKNLWQDSVLLSL